MPSALPDILHGSAGKIVFIAMFGSLWLELVMDQFGEKRWYCWKDSLVNLSCGAATAVFRTSFQTAQYAALLALLPFFSHVLTTEGLRPWDWVGIYLVVDLTIYWKHRIMHLWPPLWAFHLVHHNSQELNLSTGLRLNWFEPLANIPFMIPLVMVGLPPEAVLLCYSIDHTYQFWPHTRAIGKLGWLDGIFNTPANHWVHHGTNPQYVNKNFGGTLIIWDRIFGTYEPYGEKAKFGVTSGFHSFNLIRVEFQGMWDLLRGRLSYRG